MDSIGAAYGSTSAPLLRRRGPDGQLQPRRRALSRVATVAEPADSETGTPPEAAAVSPPRPQDGADRRRPAAAGTGHRHFGHARRHRTPAARRRRATRRAAGHRGHSHGGALHAAADAGRFYGALPQGGTDRARGCDRPPAAGSGG